MTTCFKFIGGFASGLLEHIARVAVWGLLAMLVASLLDLTPSWQILALIGISNIIGAVIYSGVESQ